ncbi:MAG TPA: GNAT family N-acetyltransferase [Candidatus Nitrosotenuis sp.]|jgi:GNAT superfamily N-acetyltransferase|nr:GNAT family N-acetyltransferase [Candidatus Nitrosotenuis sp.]
MNLVIEQISPEQAQILCQEITHDLPEYFGLPEVNEQYFQGMLTRFSFAAKLDGHYVGLLTLEFPYPETANIYWMAVKRDFQGRGIGRKLVHTASNYVLKQGIKTLTVETLSPVHADQNYLKTYPFYINSGFRPLFDLKPEGYEFTMVYLYKPL